jgi:hypothetical protein
VQDALALSEQIQAGGGAPIPIPFSDDENEWVIVFEIPGLTLPDGGPVRLCQVGWLDIEDSENETAPIATTAENDTREQVDEPPILEYRRWHQTLPWADNAPVVAAVHDTNGPLAIRSHANDFLLLFVRSGQEEDDIAALLAEVEHTGGEPIPISANGGPFVPYFVLKDSEKEFSIVASLPREKKVATTNDATAEQTVNS